MFLQSTSYQHELIYMVKLVLDHFVQPSAALFRLSDSWPDMDGKETETDNQQGAPQKPIPITFVPETRGLTRP